MQDYPYILAECQEINSLLYSPLNGSQRIKYTCFTVSKNYIVLGSTSGSLYLFSKDPCSFCQLIPLSEGAVSRIEVSPDEKAIALATTKGTVCLVSLKPNIKLVTVCNEHSESEVTSLCWNDNCVEAYAGDNAGRISVLVLTNFSVNGIFQSSSTTLMNLDSGIVQMSFSGSLLLISTLSRTFLCDTVQEQYKQIGNKARDGKFGACFYKSSTNGSNDIESSNGESAISDSNNGCKKVTSNNGISQLNGYRVTEEISNCQTKSGSQCKIYCARPSSRLWEVTLDGTVVNTHQFKEALAVAPLPVYRPFMAKVLSRERDEYDQLVNPWPVQSINFPQLFVISDKYLVSHCSSCLYVLDPENGDVVLWTDEYTDVESVCVVEDKIYVMSASRVFHCLQLTNVDQVVLKLYEQNLHKECLELCQRLRPKLLLQTRNCDNEVGDDKEISEALLSIVGKLRACHNKSDSSGIVIINNLGKMNGDVEVEVDKLKALALNGSMDEEADEEEEEAQQLLQATQDNHSELAQKDTEADVQSENLTDDHHPNAPDLLLKVQLNLDALTSLTESLTEESKLEEIISRAEKVLSDAKDQYLDNNDLADCLYEAICAAEARYESSLLENLSLELLAKLRNADVLKELVRIYVNVESDKNFSCICNFPYADEASKSRKPKFLEIGRGLVRCTISKQEGLCWQLCSQIPYLWREYLPFKEAISDFVLQQCLLSADSKVLSLILPAISDRQLSVVAQSLGDIESKCCLYCKKTFDNQIVYKNFFIDWNQVLTEAFKRLGPNQKMPFLVRFTKYLPDISIDSSIYQNMIFSKILSQHGVQHPVELNTSEQSAICSSKILEELKVNLEKDLGNKVINSHAFGSGSHHWGMKFSLKSATCPCCTLSLQTPVLLGTSGIALFSCGHVYHVNCMIQKKITKCYLHNN